MISQASARRVSIAGIPPMWVLGGGNGGRRAVCLLRAKPAPNTGAAGFALTCASPEQAAGGFLMGIYTRLDGRATLVEGVVPDGVKDVSLNLGGSHRRRLIVRGNAYGDWARRASSVTFGLAGITHTVPVPVPPAAAALSGGAR